MRIDCIHPTFWNSRAMGKYVTMIAQLGFKQSHMLMLWCAVLSLFCCSTVLSCALSIEGITGEEDSRWLRTHAAKKDGYRFACNIIAGKTTNSSNWPNFRLGLFCALTRCSHWYEHCFGHVQFRGHWVAQLPQPWFTLCNCVIIAYVITHGARSARQIKTKPPPEVVSRMRIGMCIDANAHQSMNAWIRIECALLVLCEQALRQFIK